jgi:hypothetical protein
MYGVPGGKSDAGTIESNVAVILPVALDMTKVAADSRPDLIAREDARTVTGESMYSSGDKPFGGDLGGVG